MMAALLAEARPVALEDDVLVLSYPASASFSKRKIEDAPTASASAGAAAGVRPPARGALRDTRRPGEPDESGTPPVRLTEDEVIDAVQERVRRRGTGGRAAEEN